jgi:DnaJ-class molecular chaperone
MTPPRKDYYGVLRLTYGASQQLIRQRYRRLARRFHPDVNQSPDSVTRFRDITEAYEVLTTPEMKRIVDTWYTNGSTFTHEPSASGSTFVTTARHVRADSLVQRLFVFGCFGALTFVTVIFGGWMSQEMSSHAILAVGLTVAALVGWIAARSHTDVQERILRWLGWWS